MQDKQGRVASASLDLRNIGPIKLRFERELFLRKTSPGTGGTNRVAQSHAQALEFSGHSDIFVAL